MDIQKKEEEEDCGNCCFSPGSFRVSEFVPELLDAEPEQTHFKWISSNIQTLSVSDKRAELQTHRDVQAACRRSAQLPSLNSEFYRQKRTAAICLDLCSFYSSPAEFLSGCAGSRLCEQKWPCEKRRDLNRQEEVDLILVWWFDPFSKHILWSWFVRFLVGTFCSFNPNQHPVNPGRHFLDYP